MTEIVCVKVVNKETLTREIVEKLFRSVQLGPADTKKSFTASKYCLVLSLEARNLWKILSK